MAFVINKSELNSVFHTNNTNPGPGAYSKEQLPIYQRPAPFNTSSYKQSCFQSDQTAVGPGAYSRTSIAECFRNKSTCVSSFKSKVQRPDLCKKTYYNSQQNHQNHYQSQKSLNFCNHTKRVHTQQSQQQKRKQKKGEIQNLRRLNKSRKVNSIIQNDKQTVRIIFSNPKNTQNVESFYIDQNICIKQGAGPGQYDINGSLLKKHKSVVDWSRQQKRFRKNKTSSSINPGPGQYQTMSKTQKCTRPRMTSSFSYSGVRSYMDTIIYKTNNQMKMKIMENKKLKDKSPGPADYCPQKIGKDSFYYGKQVIGSTGERFALQTSKVTIPGPGYYANSQCRYKYSGIIKQVRNKIFGKTNHLVFHHHEPGFVPLEKQLRDISQNDQNNQQLIPCTLKQRCQSKAGSISRQPRFKNKLKSKSPSPGPGEYFSLFKKEGSPQKSGVFKSNIGREPFIIKKQNPTIPFYDIGIEDIAYRTDKKKCNIESLKKVAIEKPAFDSSVSRFNESKKIHSWSDKSIHPDIIPFDRDQINYDQFKPYKQKTSYASVFRSTTTREPFQIKLNPGPGSYDCAADNLNKKTFNIQYLRAARQKALSSSKMQA